MGLSFRAESQRSGRKSRSKIDREQQGRGESGLGVGDMEVGVWEGMCRCMLTHKDENPPQQWPLDYIRAASQLVQQCPQELFI